VGRAAVALFLAKLERAVDDLSLPGLEDPTAVAHQHLWRPMLLDGSVEHQQIRRQVLALKVVAGQNGAREVLEHGDDVDGSPEGRNLMVPNIAHIAAPGLVAILRIVGMLLR
jgi:hypothetical protein